MAEVGELKIRNLGEVRIYEWTLTEAGVGAPILLPRLTDRSYAMFGTWDGATVDLEGGWDQEDKDNDDAYMTLHESDNTTAITNTANACGVVLENPVWVRPKLANAGVGTAVKVALVAR